MLIGALVLTSVTAGTFAFLWLRGGGGPEAVNEFIAETSPAAEDTARRVVDILMNYDSTNLEDRRQEMLELSTGKFRDEYDEFTEQLGAALEETKASSRGQLIGDPNIAFRSPSQAIAIMRATQTTQSSENPEGQTLEYVLEVTLLDTSEEGWKADSVEILSETRS